MSAYQDRVKKQMLQWVNGVSAHNLIDNECCPDFSCCVPELFETEYAKRAAAYAKQYGAS